MFAKVILNNKAKMLNRTFDYTVPEEMKGKIKVGSRVLVPFSNRKEDGYVIGFSQKSEFECKPVAELLTNEEIEEYKIELAKIMSKRYFCNLSECIKLMVNPEMNTKNIDGIMKDKKIKYVVLDEENYINYNKKIELLEKTEEKVSKKEYLTPKSLEVIEILKANNNEIKLKEILEKYSSSVINGLEKRGIIYKEEKNIEFEDYMFLNEKYTNIDKEEDLVLNKEQQKIYDEIEYQIEKSRSITNLIYGVTGSGKTEIYIRLIRKAVELRKNSISVSTRNITNTTNVNKIYKKIWRKYSGIT